MTQGVITLLYKGKGARSSLDSYRPITLLNSDYKLLAKALAIRLGPRSGIASIYAPAERQERTPFFQGSLLEGAKG